MAKSLTQDNPMDSIQVGIAVFVKESYTKTMEKNKPIIARSRQNVISDKTHVNATMQYICPIEVCTNKSFNMAESAC